MEDTDIVRQLLDSVHQCRALDRSTLLAAAAQEIQALRKDLEIAKAAVAYWKEKHDRVS